MADSIERRVEQTFPCYYDLYVPESAGPKPLLLALHGYGGDKRSMMKLARRINDQDFVIVALQGPHQHLVMPTEDSPKLGYGFGWLSNFKPEDSVALHHRLLNQIIDELGESGQADTSRVFLLGFSQACGVNFRYAFTHDRVRGVVAICGGIPGDWPSAEETESKYHSGSVDVLYIAAERDEFYTPERMRQNAEALKRRARSVELQIFDAKHEVPRASYSLMNEWLLRQAGR
ncbi:MAG: dienelactone hydrolase family protein [Acidobacteria bacterium]|nr:dienelactone hydrolase family protein [Acidobacteriota bacterium]